MLRVSEKYEKFVWPNYFWRNKQTFSLPSFWITLYIFIWIFKIPRSCQNFLSLSLTLNFSDMLDTFFTCFPCFFIFFYWKLPRCKIYFCIISFIVQFNHTHLLKDVNHKVIQWAQTAFVHDIWAYNHDF